MNLGQKSYIFLRMISPIIVRKGIDSQRFLSLKQKIQNEEDPLADINRNFTSFNRPLSDKNDINAVPSQAGKCNGLVLQQGPLFNLLTLNPDP